jgi:hypothetical protein
MHKTTNKLSSINIKLIYLLLMVFSIKAGGQTGEVHLRGKVVDLIGNGVNSAEVDFYGLRPDLPRTMVTFTDEFGGFAFDSIAPFASIQNKSSKIVHNGCAFSANTIEYFDLKGRLLNSPRGRKSTKPFSCIIIKNALDRKKLYSKAVSFSLPIRNSGSNDQRKAALIKTSAIACELTFSKIGYIGFSELFESTVTDIGSRSIAWSKIKMISPNGGETYRIGEIIPIIYYANPESIATPFFLISTEKKKNWKGLFEHPVIAVGIDTMFAVLPDSIYGCIDSISTCTNSTISDSCTIRIRDYMESKINDDSDSCFRVLPKLN